MDPAAFYRYIWGAKSQDGAAPVAHRDWFHRYLLDRIVDPTAHPRHEVALPLLRGGERLLDVGCWNGHFLQQVQETGKYRVLCGVDIVPEAVSMARSKGFDAHIVDLNSDGLPFPDRSVDAVTMLGVLEHVFDPYSMVREVWRVLKPGGDFVVAVPNTGSFTNRIRILLGRIPVTSLDPGWDGGHLHYFTAHALNTFLAQEGFKVLDRKVTGGARQLRECWCSLLGGELVYLCRRV
jgi:methionine biosynthesis protein MetW